MAHSPSQNSRIAGVAAGVVLALASVCAAQEKAAIWKVEGAASTVYLAGSVHLLRQQDHPLPQAYNTVYDDSERIYFEVDLAEMESMANKMKMIRMSMIPNGGLVEDLISEETYAALETYIAENEQLSGMAKMLKRMTPGMLSLTIASVEAMKIGAIPDLGVEKVFDTKARADKKPVAGLETVEFQMGLFNNLSDEEQDNLLKMTLQQVKETPEMLDGLIETWKSGDTKALDELLNKYFNEEENVALTKAVLYDRNASWIPAIEKELKQPGNAMFIVGAGHLVGKKSVIEMLQAKGHKPVQFGR